MNRTQTAAKRWWPQQRRVAIVWLPALALALGGQVGMAQTGDEASLARGAVPDTTPQQRYQSAIREAGGGLKVSLQECRSMGGAERKSCESQARATYQADMARAKAMLRDPSIQPVNVQGGPIRGTETVYEIQK